MPPSDLRINRRRMLNRLDELARVGGLPDGGVCRLALTDDDKAGRDLVCQWMRQLDLEVSIDAIGNVVAVRPGAIQGPPVVIGSHIDTVATGGPLDGNLGVLAGLEVIETLNDAGIGTQHPMAVAFFTNEEGARFAPDMMGSAVHQGVLPLDQALATHGIDGTTVKDDLDRIGYRGDVPCGQQRAITYLELHIEQGPVLEQRGVTIGAVEGVQGISWTELTINGVSNHAGTTPMAMRTDAGFAAAAVATFVRELASELGGHQVATVGALTLHPNLVNVIPARAIMTVDLRNTDELILQRAEQELTRFLAELEAREGVQIARRSLARFEPVAFCPQIVELVETTAQQLGHTVQRLPSGAGHDAQMFAPNCPTGMIFVPSIGGISHNISEATAPEHLEAGANVLLHVALAQAS